MGKFKDFLKENEDTLQAIYDILDELSDEEMDEFGYFINNEFFDADTDEEGNPIEDEDEYTMDDVKAMINTLGPEYYEDILDLLQPEELDFNDDGSEYDDDEEDDLEDDEMAEGVARRMKVSQMNKKSRKFFSKSRAELRQTRAERLKKNRQTRAKRKRYYNVNKKKIAAYQKSRAAAIKKGKHIVKKRRV